MTSVRDLNKLIQEIRDQEWRDSLDDETQDRLDVAHVMKSTHDNFPEICGCGECLEQRQWIEDHGPA